MSYFYSPKVSNQPNLESSDAFEDFLSTYESTISDLDVAATDALEGLSIVEDNASDEYVMVDNEGEKGASLKPGHESQTKKKYMHMLQKVANRQISEVSIELDDLDNVRYLFLDVNILESNLSSPVRKELWRRYGT